MTLQLIKASAGSGKTFRLAQEYLKLLLQMNMENFNDGYFSQILAITFTNAATAEMKERILHELFVLGYQTSQSPHLYSLLNGKSEDKLAENARKALEKILTRYDRFSISTIDKFFQTIVRSIIHEANIPGNFEIELDTRRLTEKAIDSRLADLSTKDPLYYWINLLREEKLREGGNFTFRNELSKLADTLQHKKWNSNRSEEDLNKLKKFYTTIKQELGRLEEEGKAYMRAVEEALPPGISFSRKINRTITNSVFENHFQTIRNSTTLSTILRSEEAPSDACLGFLTQANQKKISPDDRTLLTSFYNKARSLYEWIFATERYVNTLRTLKNTFISFSVLSYLEEAVNQYCLDNQILTLQQSNLIISNKIKGFDAPFIFEKLGQRYRNIFIDEFQDTAKIQFDNLAPLLEETLSTNNTNLIVGDIKQSIYRWREGDWRLLHQTVAERFPTSVKEENLQYNFRSSVDIVSFNNAFYALAAPLIIHSITSELESSPHPATAFPDIDAIAQVYSTASQIHRKEHAGIVSAQFYPVLDPNPGDDLKEEYNLLPLEVMLRQIDECLNAGYRKKDILILYRNNKSGREIAEFLLRKANELEKDYRFTSQESLSVGKSASVSLIISLLNYISDRDKSISMAEMVHFSHLLGINKSVELATVEGTSPEEANKNMRKNLYLTFPGLEELLAGGQNMTLLEMVNAGIAVFRLNEHSESMEYAYLLKLQDQILEFTEKNDQNLGNFLDYWADKGKNASLDLPKNIDAIRLLSIHRAKGLQAPVVILPFANLEFKGTHRTTMWSEWDEEASETVLHEFADLGPFPVNLNSSAEKSFFSRAYINEQILQYLDTLNLYYVATTRAEDRLYMIFESETENNANKPWQLTTGQLIRRFFHAENEKTNSSTGTYGNFEVEEMIFGNPVESGPVNRVETEEEKQYQLQKMHIHRSDLGIKSEWLPEKLSSTLVQENESIERGLLTHELLEEISSAADPERVIHKAVLDGRISKSEEVQWRNHLFTILNHPDIAPFFEEGLEVINEQGIIAPGAKVQRPDRIVISGHTTTIIDYKTGQKREQYQKQIQAYAALLFEMGFPGIQGYILYTDVPELIRVPLNYQSKIL